MDLNSLKDQVSNLTLYDLKAGVRKVQNGMFVHVARNLDEADRSHHSCNELHRDGGEGLRTVRLTS